MAVSRDVARVNFARFVRRTLDRAHAQGLTNRQIEERTGVSPTTFHRWDRAQWGRKGPELQTVIDFCEGLGVEPAEAFAAMGIQGRQVLEPEPPLDPDLRRLLRKMADPNVSEATKAYIRATLVYLANVPDAPQDGRRRRSA